MICPKCKTGELSSGMGAGGIQIDRCLACGGVWLDKGELGSYIKDTSKFDKAMAEALKAAAGRGLRCPRCESELMSARLEKGGLELESCPKCSGLWLDQGEFAALKSAFG